MKLTSLVLTLTVTLSLIAGCKKKPDCKGAAGAAIERSLADDIKGLPDTPRKAAEAKIPKLREVAIGRCTEDKWDGDVLQCMTGAQAGPAADDYTRCARMLTSEQGKALEAAIEAADPKGADCEPIVDAIERVMADTVKDAGSEAQAAAAVTTKVMQAVALKRCAADKWSQLAVRCIAAVKSEDPFQHCASKLTASQRSALDDAMATAIAAIPSKPRALPPGEDGSAAGSGSGSGSGDKPSEDKPSEDKPSEDKPSEDKPAEDKPAEDKPSGGEGEN